MEQNCTPEEFLNSLDNTKAPKGSTDEYYTPANIYKAVLQWVLKEYPQTKGKRILRPFYPGGDYKAEDYTGAVVIDNPPFSILAEIRNFYCQNDIPYFLFAPHKSPLLQTPRYHDTTIITGNQEQITYLNGKAVPTHFCTNMEQEGAILHIAPSLTATIVREIRNSPTHNQRKRISKYQYPKEVETLARLKRYAHIPLKIYADEIQQTRKLDQTHPQTNKKINPYGDSFFLHPQAQQRISTAIQYSDYYKTELAKEIAPNDPYSQGIIKIQLTEREQNIIKTITPKPRPPFQPPTDTKQE